MIFVTIGSVFPFDRMVRAADEWAEAHPGEEMLAQIGEGGYAPRHMKWVRRLGRADYADAVARARLVVAHAGMGSVITAGQAGKPIVILARRRALGEHNTDHQVDTARWLATRRGVFVAEDEAALAARIGEALAAGGAGEAINPFAPPAFTDRLRAAILG